MGAETQENTSDSCACCASCSAVDADDEKRRNTAPFLIIGAAATIMAAILHFIDLSGPILSFIPMVFAAIASVFGLIIIAPAVKSAVVGRSIDINILMVIAVIGAWLLGDYVEAAAVLFFFSLGNWLEDFAIDRNRSSIEKLMDLTPQTVRIRQNGKSVELAPEDVGLGSTVVIRPGDRIALDGRVTEGHATVDESPITGESTPVLKQPGDSLYAGSLSVDGKLEFVTTSTIKDSTLARIVELVKESQKKRTPYERFINRFARFYTPLVILIAAIVAIVPTLVSLLSPYDLGGIATWGYRALALLVIACPCALVIATPVSVVSGLTQSARMGVLVKGGAFLELSSKVRAIAFDKTGTLTYGRPEVKDVVVLPSAPEALDKKAVSRESILLLTAALEQHSTHPLAHAVVAAIEEGARIPQAVAVSESAGRGITGFVEKRALAVGSPSFATSLATLDESVLAQIAEIEQSAATVLVLLVDLVPVALIAVKDSIRQESPALLRQLRQTHEMHTVMLTGDNPTTASAIASEVGIDKVYAGLLPHEKMDRVEEMKREYGNVAMVGDGINDAPALALADVGIAMGAASSDTAIQVADVALMANSIEVLPQFFRLSQKVVNTIRTNVFFALLVKAAVMVLAILGIAQIWMAIFADVGVLVIVLLYSMRLGLPIRRQGD